MRKWQQHWLATILLMPFLAVGGTVLAPGAPAVAAPAASPDYVKYYVVAASYQGKPEDLGEIAMRFLGTSARAQEIFNLNSGRIQPDGGRLSDPNQLYNGWSLALPWDAVGSGVQYGMLPSAAPKPAAAPTRAAKPNPAPAQPAAKPATQGAAKCAVSSQGPTNSATQWATLRLSPDHAWAYTRGAGVLVAVVDSGVDASLPALTGRVTEGTDIVSGSGRGDTDCLGTGTIMASIVAARSDQGGQVSGIAPDATVLPVRLVTTDPKPKPADQAAAIEFAVAAGAKVIALGSYLTPTDPAVVAAIAKAGRNDTVVVVGAPTGPGQPAPASPAAASPVLRVGGVGIDGALAAAYTPNTVDVVAPGAQVAGLGISGTGVVSATGTQYGVAFAAGQVALVRARFPQLTAAEVIRRIEATADRIGGTAPDPRYGWGLIDLGVSVTRVIPDEGRVAAPAAPPHGPGLATGPRIVALVIIVLVSLAAVILLILRLRRIIRPTVVAPQPGFAVAEEPESAAAVVTRMGVGQSPSTVDNGRRDNVGPTVGVPTPTGADGARSARGFPAPDTQRQASPRRGARAAQLADLGTGERGSGDGA